MAEDSKKRGLGRGLSALLGEQTDTLTGQSSGAVTSAPIDLIAPNADQPRRHFDPTDLEELAASLRERGMIQPIVVRPDPARKGGYQIVAGERRWRAAQMAQLHEAPIVVRDLSDVEVLEVAIVENIQRADLNPIEEAAGYAQLIEKFDHTQERLSKVVGKSRSHIANALRLLSLPEDVRKLLVEGRLSAGHARALVTADDPTALAKQVIERGLSVRETEKLAKAAGGFPKRQPAPKTHMEKDADTRVLEGELSAALSMRVSIDHKDVDGAGEVRVTYRSLDQLDEICRKLSAV